MEYHKVIPKEYAENLKQKFLKNPSLWFDVIIPKEKAEELIKRTHGDFSLIWHEHCEQCWENIDRSTMVCYQSEDGVSWLCQNCYEKMNHML